MSTIISFVVMLYLVAFTNLVVNKPRNEYAMNVACYFKVHTHFFCTFYYVALA